MYFSKFPYIKYQFPDDVVRFYKNLSIRPQILIKVKEYSQNLKPYVVKEGEMPDHIAYDSYGDSKLHWVVMLANDILNLHTDWPKTPIQLRGFLREKYGTQVSNKGKEWVLTDLELQRYLEFEGTPQNSFQSFVILDSERNGFVKDSDGELTDSDEYLMIEPWKLKHEPVESAYPDVKFPPRYIKPNTWRSKENAFGRFNTHVGDITPVSYYEYEFELNEEKRNILLPRREVVDAIIDEFPELVRQ